jgi:hypothetical protein
VKFAEGEPRPGLPTLATDISSGIPRVAAPTTPAPNPPAP